MTDPEIAHRNPYYEVRVETATWPDGSRGAYYVVAYHGPCVVIVPRDRDRRLLMVRVARHIVGDAFWEFPAGLVEAGEDPEHAARRELLEETGHDGDALTLLGEHHPAYGSLALRCHVFLAEKPRLISTRVDPKEIVETAWFTRAEISELIASKRLIDGFALAALTWLFEHDRRGQRGDDDE